MRSRRLFTVVLTFLGFALAVDSLPQRSTAGAPGEGSAPLAARDETARVAELLGRWNPDLLVSERERIARAVQRSASSYGLPPDLVLGMIFVESAARPGARSPKGALGLMQVMPHMKAGLDLAGNSTTIESNVEAGCEILADNIARLGEDRGISAYFWGSKRGGDWYLHRVRAAQREARLHLEADEPSRRAGEPRSPGTA